VAFTSSGTYTVPDGVTEVEITAIGGGGGGGPAEGGDAGGGGGQGGTEVVLESVTPGTVLTVQIGAGGVGRPDLGECPATAGGLGGMTRILLNGHVLVTAQGGNGGTAPCLPSVADAAGGLGASATASLFGTTVQAIPGSPGQPASGTVNCPEGIAQTAGVGAGVPRVAGSGGAGANEIGTTRSVPGCITAPTSTAGISGYAEILPM